MKIKIDRLKEIREERGLLQKDVAKVLKMSRVQYSRHERGILANFYNTSIDYLLCLTDERNPYKVSVMQ